MLIPMTSSIVGNACRIPAQATTAEAHSTPYALDPDPLLSEDFKIEEDAKLPSNLPDQQSTDMIPL